MCIFEIVFRIGGKTTVAEDPLRSEGDVILTRATLLKSSLLTFVGAFASLGSSSAALALDRASSSESFGLSLSGHYPTLVGNFTPVLNSQMGGSIAADIGADWLSENSRLFLMVGMQNYGVQDEALLSLSTFDTFAGLRLSSSPYFWVAEPTLAVGVGATFGTLQIDGTTSETQNGSTWFSALLSPGIAFKIGAGFSAGVELPVRFTFSTERLTTISPAITLRYAL